MRLIKAKDKIYFLKNNKIDLISIIPFNSIFKSLRVLKVTRIIKVTKLAIKEKLDDFDSLSEEDIKDLYNVLLSLKN